MNTTEHLVEVYYRQIGCFTVTDIKVIKGNNRQFDLLAFNYKTKKFYHVEVSVAHGLQWTDSLNDIKKKIDYKFFGNPKDLRPENSKTDFTKEKKYLEQIKATYSKFGIDYNEVIRVWCTWFIQENDITVNNWKNELASEYNLKPENFEILLFRDTLLPTLLENIGTAYYDDELLRTLSLLKEYTRQKNKE